MLDLQDFDIFCGNNILSFIFPVNSIGFSNVFDEKTTNIKEDKVVILNNLLKKPLQYQYLYQQKKWFL